MPRGPRPPDHPPPSAAIPKARPSAARAPRTPRRGGSRSRSRGRGTGGKGGGKGGDKGGGKGGGKGGRGPMRGSVGKDDGKGGRGKADGKGGDKGGGKNAVTPIGRVVNPTFTDAYGVGPHRARLRPSSSRDQDSGAAGAKALWERFASDRACTRGGRPHDLFRGPLKRLWSGWAGHGKVTPARRAQL